MKNLNKDYIFEAIAATDFKEKFSVGDKCILLTNTSKNKHNMVLVAFATVTGVSKTKVKYDVVRQGWHKEEFEERKGEEITLKSKSDLLPSRSNWSTSTVLLPHDISEEAVKILLKGKGITANYYWAYTEHWIDHSDKKYACDLYMHDSENEKDINDREYKKMDMDVFKDLVNKYFK